MSDELKKENEVRSVKNVAQSYLVQKKANYVLIAEEKGGKE